MSYNIDELFRFEKTYDGYALAEYLKKGDPSVTELEIPNEYNGLPVVKIGIEAFVFSRHLEKVTIPESVRQIEAGAFALCGNLRSVSLPASLEEIGRFAFEYCGELREVEFKSSPNLGDYVFGSDSKLPAELILAGQIGSLDITQPIGMEMLKKELLLKSKTKNYLPWFTHAGALALAVQNDCFRDVDAELLDELIEYCVKEKMVEQTAYLLELKKRKFGFKKDGDLDL